MPYTPDTVPPGLFIRKRKDFYDTKVRITRNPDGSLSEISIPGGVRGEPRDNPGATYTPVDAQVEVTK